MSYEIATIISASSQRLTDLGLRILASTIVSVLILVAFLILFFRWLEGGAPSGPKVSVCMYCGSKSLSVSPVRDAAGRDTAFCYCNNCKRYFSLDVPAR